MTILTDITNSVMDMLLSVTPRNNQPSVNLPSESSQLQVYCAVILITFVGAERYGRRWKIILNAYPFQPGRTAIDLKDKYKKLKV